MFVIKSGKKQTQFAIGTLKLFRISPHDIFKLSEDIIPNNATNILSLILAEKWHPE
jgi:hypothetical protein